MSNLLPHHYLPMFAKVAIVHLEQSPDLRHGEHLVEQLRHQAHVFGDVANQRIIDSCDVICIERFGETYRPIARRDPLQQHHGDAAAVEFEDVSQEQPDWD
ncbi:MAG: hypothetical protein C0522_13825 [Rhodocyclaceae bacterium]|nr:hypothetical protein [Rhodocyclaceae bacterium]